MSLVVPLEDHPHELVISRQRILYKLTWNTEKAQDYKLEVVFSTTHNYNLYCENFFILINYFVGVNRALYLT